MVRFAVIGDTHFVAAPAGGTAGAAGTAAGGEAWVGRRGNAATLAFYAAATQTVWPQVVREIREAAPDFVIQAGDLTEGGFTAAVGVAADLRHALERLEELGCPGVVAQGNHDRSPAALAVPAWQEVVLPWVSRQVGQFGQIAGGGIEREHFAFDVDGCRFVVIDPTLAPGDEQHAWLRRTLGETGPRRRFVVGHYPVVPLGRPAFAPFGFATEIGPELGAAGVDAYFCAHTHNQTVSVHALRGEHEARLLQVTGAPVGVLEGGPHRFGTGIVPLPEARPLCAGPYRCGYLWGFLEDSAPGWYLVEVDDSSVTLRWHQVGAGPRGWVRCTRAGSVEEAAAPAATIRRMTSPSDRLQVRAARLRVAGYGAALPGKRVWVNGEVIGELPPLGAFAPGPAMEMEAGKRGELWPEVEVKVAMTDGEEVLLGALLLECDLADGRRVRTQPSQRLWTTVAADQEPKTDWARWVNSGWFGDGLVRLRPGDPIREVLNWLL
jgi:hypothetical protein